MEVINEVKFEDVKEEEVEVVEFKTEVKEDTYDLVKMRANLEGLDDSELARILLFLPTKAIIYIIEVMLF